MPSVALKAVRSPERQALADCIARRDAAAKASRHETAILDAFDVNLDETRSAYYTAREACDTAQKTRQDLLARHAGNERAMLEHCVRNGLPDPNETIRTADEALKVARDNLDAGNRGRFRLESAKSAAEANLERAKKETNAAIAAIELTSLSRVLAEAERARNEYQRLRHVLTRLGRHISNLDMRNEAFAPTDPLHLRLREFLTNGRCDEMQNEALAPWAAAAQALSEDPDAELPQ